MSLCLSSRNVVLWRPCLALVLALSCPVSLARATYAWPDVQYVPTERLIANLEQRLRKTTASNRVRPGESITVHVVDWRTSWQPHVYWWPKPTADAPPPPEVSGTYEIDASGAITLPTGDEVQIAGKTVEEVQAQLQTRFDRGDHAFEIRTEQLPQQRPDRGLAYEIARLHYQLARVHSIAAFHAFPEFPVDKRNGTPFVHTERERDRDAAPDILRKRFDDMPAPSEAARAHHLSRAIEHYSEALALHPEDMASQLGIAWTLDQQGRREAALREYRKAFGLARQLRLQAGSPVSFEYASEIADYLLALLDPDRDAEEIRQLEAYRSEAFTAPRFVTPILLPMRADAELDDLIDRSASVTFDLDGSGRRTRWQWITPSAAWLVFDPERTGRITSGLQMMGKVTFWVFWKDGYAALAALDDDGDGELRDDELAGLALWHDENGDGKSEPGEVIPIDEAGILALSTRSVHHPAGFPYHPQGVTYRDGSTRPTYDWIVPASKPQAF